MCFWQWLIVNKEIIMVLSDAATAGAFIVIGLAFILTARSFVLQKKDTQAGIFHGISTEINTIISEQKECEEKKDDAVILHWYQRLIDAFEYYAFFANRKYLSKDMRTFYRGALIIYVDWAKGRPAVEKWYKTKDVKLLCEIRKYYEKYSGHQFPFSLSGS